MAEMKVSISETMSLTTRVTTKSSTSLALHDLFTACRLATRIGKIEHQEGGEDVGSKLDT
jgi:hypothetical protein